MIPDSLRETRGEVGNLDIGKVGVESHLSAHIHYAKCHVSHVWETG